jgi:HK97 family phage major capsid protein
MKNALMMGAAHAALMGKIATHSHAAYEKREAPDMAALTATIEQLGKRFEDFKATNDEALKQKDVVTEEKLTKLNGELDRLSELKKRLEDVETRAARPGFGDGGERAHESRQATEHRQAFAAWMRNPTDPQVMMNLKQKEKALETRAAQVVTSSGAAGGFALPEVVEQTIARLTRDISPIRQIATVRQVSSPDYKELFDVNGTAFEWVAEAGTRNQTNTSDLAEVAPSFGMISAKPQASEESLDDLFFDVETWLQTTVAEAFAVGEGQAHISGDGTNKPTGFLTGTPVATSDASRAFGVLQYTASGQAAALPTSLDVMYDLIYSLRARYRANARFVTAKSVLASLRKYKDSQNAYLWQPSLVLGQPDTFMGYAITEAEDMPTVAANSFPLAFGDFREGYLIADRVGLRITRDEVTSPGFVKWYIRRRTGGKIRNSQAIKLLKIAAS